MVPPAPVVFSTSTFWPSALVMRCAMIRAMVSVGPPAENGTMIVTGCVGNSWAPAANASRKTLRKSAMRIMLVYPPRTELYVEPVVMRPAQQVLVAHREEHARLLRMMLDARPGRNRERVAELPVEALAADGRAAAALHHGMDGVGAVAIGPVAPARIPAVHLERDGRHG